MDVPGGGQREACLRVLSAVLLGGFVFPCWLALPAGFANSGYWGPLASAYPPTVEFIRWAGAGVVAGLAAASMAPRWRWIVVAPLVLILEGAYWFLVFLVVGAGDVAVPQGTREGMAVGTLVGALSPVVVRAGMTVGRRVMVVVAAALLLLAVPAVSAWRGRPQVAAMREDVLPAAERLLSANVLANAGPAQWIVVRRKMSGEGVVSAFAYGEMRRPKAQIYLESRSPLRMAGKGGEPEGLSLDRFEVQIEVPEPHMEALISDRQCEPGVVDAALRAAALRPELLASVAVRKYEEGAGCYASARYHGMEYEVDWHTRVVYEFTRIEYFPSMLIRLKGTYSAAH